MNLNKTLLRIFLSLCLTLFPLGLVRADGGNPKIAFAVNVIRSLPKQELKGARYDTFLADTVQIPSGEISYHNGLVMTNTPDVYFIWYGTWDVTGPGSTRS